MSKTLLNYAVSFTEIFPTSAASLAFLHQIGVVVKPSVTAPDVVLTGTGIGDATIPAVLTLSGLYRPGDILDATFESDVPFIGQAPLTILEHTTAEDAAILWADYIKGIDQLTAVAVGETVEVRAFAPGVNVTVSAPVYTPTLDPVEPYIAVITSQEQLPYYTDQWAEIGGAFDGGMNRVYLIVADDILGVPALLVDKECEFYTVYGSSDYLPDEYMTAFANWQGVKGFTTIDEVTGAVQAADFKQNVFYEDTLIISESTAYFGLYSFGSLLSGATWRNQQYIPVSAEAGTPVLELGTAELLFDERLSFYLTDEEQGTRLAFFVAGGVSITTPYINEEIKVVMQSRMLNFLSANQPMNIERNRRLLEQVGQKVIDQYLEAGLLDPAGENSITITQSNELFIVDGVMETTEAVALWRVQIDAIQQTGG